MKINLIISDSFYFTKDVIQKTFKNESDIIKIDLLNCEISDLIYEVSTPSLFDENKNIVVENADELFSKSFESQDFEELINNPSEFSNIIFVYALSIDMLDAKTLQPT